jgi:hypothetical protein
LSGLSCLSHFVVLVAVAVAAAVAAAAVVFLNVVHKPQSPTTRSDSTCVHFPDLE